MPTGPTAYEVAAAAIPMRNRKPGSITNDGLSTSANQDNTNEGKSDTGTERPGQDPKANDIAESREQAATGSRTKETPQP